MGTCAIATCENNGRKKSKYCKNCAASFGYAVRQLGENPNWVKERKHKIDKYQERMLYLSNTEKGKPYATRIQRALKAPSAQGKKKNGSQYRQV